MEQINREYQSNIEADQKMKETFITKSNDEYNKIFKQYQEEEERFQQELQQLRKLHREKIRNELLKRNFFFFFRIV